MTPQEFLLYEEQRLQRIEARKKRMQAAMDEQEIDRQINIRMLGRQIKMSNAIGPGNAYYKTERWQRLRKYVLRKASHICQRCESPFADCVHHTDYRYIKTKGEIHYLVALCTNCHNELHSENRL